MANAVHGMCDMGVMCRWSAGGIGVPASQGSPLVMENCCSVQPEGVVQTSTVQSGSVTGHGPGCRPDSPTVRQPQRARAQLLCVHGWPSELWDDSCRDTDVQPMVPPLVRSCRHAVLPAARCDVVDRVAAPRRLGVDSHIHVPIGRHRKWRERLVAAGQHAGRHGVCLQVVALFVVVEMQQRECLLYPREDVDQRVRVCIALPFGARAAATRRCIASRKTRQTRQRRREQGRGRGWRGR